MNNMIQSRVSWSKQWVCHLWIVAIVIFFAGCTSTENEKEQPELRLVSIEKLPAGKFEQDFQLGFKLINPTEKPLKVKGMVFSVELEGYELIKGVYSGIPEVKPYGEVKFSANASVDLINSIRFFNELISQKKSLLEYRFWARVQVEKGSVKFFRENREGQISLTGVEKQ